jgi:LysR family transcriptional regulator, regulator for metE and metH
VISRTLHASLSGKFQIVERICVLADESCANTRYHGIHKLMEMMIEVRHLQMICAIAASGTMTKAAGKLLLTQPSLSHQLKEIESRLGTQLFLRINRKLILTSAGERLLSEANEILARLESVTTALQSLENSPRKLRIAAQCYTCYNWIPRLIRTFQEQFADIRVDIVEVNKDEVLKHLEIGKIDLAVTNTRVERSGVHYDKLFEDEHVLLVPPGHRLAVKRYVRLQDFQDEHLIVYNEVGGSDFFISDILEPAGIKPSQVTRMQLTEARIELVKADLGVTVVSKASVKPFLGEKTAIKQIAIGKKGLYRTWHLATLKQKRNERHIKSFADFVMKHR